MLSAVGAFYPKLWGTEKSREQIVTVVFRIGRQSQHVVQKRVREYTEAARRRVSSERVLFGVTQTVAIWR
jgi:hypothetical protein